MDTKTDNAAPWILVRLGDDFNWWLEHRGEELGRESARCGVLDPRQVRHLAQLLEEYRPYGLSKELLLAAFDMYAIEAEVEDGQLRLVASQESNFLDGNDLFAVPRITGDGDGPYYDLLDALAAARIQRLNKTHNFAHNCTVLEMDEELAALDADRFFSSDSLHVFHELSEILD